MCMRENSRLKRNGVSNVTLSIHNKKNRNVVRVLTDVQFCITNNITYRSKKYNIQNKLGIPTIIDIGSVEGHLIAD